MRNKDQYLLLKDNEDIDVLRKMGIEEYEIEWIKHLKTKKETAESHWN